MSIDVVDAVSNGWAALVAAFGVAGFVWRKILPALRRFGHFLDDVMGEKPRPGFPEGRPGVMERLAKVEESLREVRYHITPNGGRSAYDRLAGRVDALGQRLDEHIEQSKAAHAAITARLDALTPKE